MRRSCSSCFDVVLERLKKNMRGENGKRHASRSTVTLFLLSRATSFSKKTREFCSCVQNRKEQPGEYMLIDMGRLGQRSKWPTATYHDAYDRGPVARTLHLRKEKAEKEAKRMTTKSQSISFFSPFSLQEQSRVLACTVGLLLLGEMHAQCFERKQGQREQRACPR